MLHQPPPEIIGEWQLRILGQLPSIHILGYIRGHMGICSTPIMENQLENEMENEMDTGGI